MKKLLVGSLLLVLFLANYAFSGEKRLYLNGEWRFAPQFSGSELRLPKPADFSKVPLRIPSPWNVNAFSTGDGGDFRCFPSYPAKWEQARLGWCERTFEVPLAWQGDRLFVHFEAVHYYCKAYVNGHLVGEHEGGFTPFEFEITRYVHFGKPNTLLVGVKDRTFFDEKGRAPYPWGSFWGERIRGIWQDVWLARRPQVALVEPYVKTSTRKQTLTVQVKLDQAHPAPFEGELHLQVHDWPKGPTVLERRLPVKVKAAGDSTFTCVIPWAQPRLWSPEDPHLYVLELALYKHGKLLDATRVRFGFREVWLAAGHFYLNGIRRKFLGDAWHYMGIPEQSPDYARLWFRMAKAQGVNYIRLHAMVYPRFFLDVADEEGMLICDESSIWGSACNLLYTDEFFERCRNHLEAFVKRDRNHPCVVDWSVENEILAAHGVTGSADGAPSRDWLAARMAELAAWMRKFDDTRPISADGDGDLGGRLNTYSLHYPSTSRPKITGKPLLIGESGSMFYSWPSEEWRYGGDKVYLSPEGHLEALASHLQWQLQQYRAWADLVTPFNLVWYGLWPLPFDGHLRKYASLSEPGVKPERIGPYSSTLNPGYDPRLPPYLLNPVGKAIRAAFHPQQVFVEERDTAFFASEKVTRTLRVHNDTAHSALLEVGWRLVRASQTIDSGTFALRLAPAEQALRKLTLTLPEVKRRTFCTFEVVLREAGKPVYAHSFSWSVFPPPTRLAAPVAGLHLDVLAARDSQLQAPLLRVLQAAGARLHPVTSPQAAHHLLLVLPGAGGVKNEALLEWLKAGGRAFVLEGNVRTFAQLSPAGLPGEQAFCTWGAPDWLADFRPAELAFWGPDAKLCAEGWQRASTGRVTPWLVYGQGNPCLVRLERGEGLALATTLQLYQKALDAPAALDLLVKGLRYLATAPSPQSRATAVLGGDARSAVRLKQLGVTAQVVPPARLPGALAQSDLLLAPASTLETAAAKVSDLSRWLEKGGQLLVFDATPSTASVLSKLVREPVELLPYAYFNALLARPSPLLAGLTLDDLFWLEKSGQHELVKYYPQAAGLQALLVTNPLDWRRRCLRPENLKTASIVRAAKDEPLPKVPVVATLAVGKGRVILCQAPLEVDYPKARKLLSTLLVNLGVPLADRPTLSAEEAALLNVDEQGYVRAWLVCGPYAPPPNSLAAGPLPREPYFYPSEGVLAEGKLCRTVKSDAPVLDFTKVFGKLEHATCYAACYLKVPDDLTGKPFALSLGSDDRIRVWVNGKTVWHNDALRPAEPDSDLVPGVQFKPGWNRILCRVTNVTGDWGLSLRLLDASGVPAKGLLCVPSRNPAGWHQLPRKAWKGWSFKGDDLASALDGNPATRWSTDAPMRPGEWVVVDLGKRLQLAGVRLETLASPKDYPRGLRLEGSLDKSHWEQLAEVPADQCSNNLLVRLEPRPVRYLKLVQLGRTENFFWSLHELFAYSLAS